MREPGGRWRLGGDPVTVPVEADRRVPSMPDAMPQALDRGSALRQRRHLADVCLGRSDPVALSVAVTQGAALPLTPGVTVKA